MGLRLRVSIVVLGLACTLYGQTTPSRRSAGKMPAKVAPTQADRWPIESLGVEGSTHFKTAAILGITGLRVGQVAGKADFDAAREKLLATGYFETVGYSYEPAHGRPGYAAKFQVQDIAPLYPVQIVGMAGDTAGMLKALGEGDPLFTGALPPSQQALNRAARALSAYLARLNRPEKIIARVTPVENGFVIQLRPSALPNVAGATFTGNKAISTTELQSAMNAVAVGTPFTIPDYQALLENQISPLYQKLGYLRVRFGAITTEPSSPETGVLVNTVVDEGPVYKLGKVSVLGQLGDMGPTLEKALDLKASGVANYEELDAALRRMLGALRRKGYVRATGEVRKTLQDATKTVDVKFAFTRGSQYRFESLSIVGLDLEGEAAVRKMWGEAKGDPFNSDYPAFFAKQVKDSGMFENMADTKVETVLNDQALTAEVTLNFKGAGEKLKRLGEPPPTHPPAQGNSIRSSSRRNSTKPARTGLIFASKSSKAIPKNSACSTSLRVAMDGSNS